MGDRIMKLGHILFGVALPVALALPAPALAQSEPGPYARIAMLRPHDGAVTEWEAGYVRHLDWHAKNRDPYRWYGYNLWSSEHQRWFVYATFGHSAKSLSNPVSPADDERDTVVNIIPHVEFLSNSLYEFLPQASRGTGVPTPASRTEFTTVELKPGTERAFEAAITAARPRLDDETLWFRLVSGGKTPRYVRLRPKADIGAVLEDSADAALPASATALIESSKVEVLSFRPTLSYNVTPAQ